MEQKGLKKLEQALKHFKEACELLHEAHNQLDFAEASKLCGTCMEELNNPQQAALCFKKAGDTYLSLLRGNVAKLLGEFTGETDNYEAFICLSKSAELYSECGKGFSAGKVEKDIAEFIIEEVSDLQKTFVTLNERKKLQEELKEEQETNVEEVIIEEEGENEENEKKKYLESTKKVTKEDLEKIEKLIQNRLDLAIVHYEKSARFFEMSNSYGYLNSTLEQAADFSKEFGNYKKSIMFYDKLLNAKWNDASAKVGSKSKISFTKDRIITKALFAHILNLDEEDLKESLEDLTITIKDYDSISRQFKTTDEYVLINSICMSFEELDLKKYEKTVRKYSKSHKLKDDLLDCLLSMKAKLQNCIKKQNEMDDDIT